VNRREFLQSNVSVAATFAATPGTGAHASAVGSDPSAKGRSCEELVTVQTEDQLEMTGLLVTPAGKPARPIAVVWIHGASANFYVPSYVKIGRAVAARGFPFLSANTRMHDIGSVLSYQSGLRGGSYWGLPRQQPFDIAAWIGFAGARGYQQVVLVGHSAGGPAARSYQAERNDRRVIGLVMASVGLGPAPPRNDPDPRMKIAEQMVASGKGQEFLPGFRLSAATYVDYAQIPVDFWDFYGTERTTPNPAIQRIHTPLLAWFGSKEGAAAADLGRLKSLIARQGQGPVRVDTQIIENADHDYDGQEAQVARVLTGWIHQLAGSGAPPVHAGRHSSW
jgi:pimeloyl-ACP methyl ester carboxylesterase